MQQHVLSESLLHPSVVTEAPCENIRARLGGDGMTQFGRALHALNIDIICANSSPAKGRVERANRTLQDRLVKELRLAASSPTIRGRTGTSAEPH
jgi:hypothetical protein